MAHPKLQNYLRTYRRRHGLSQTEVAMLLGATADAKVSRYENSSRMPKAPTVFALEIVFNQPASELFAGDYHAVRLAVQERAQRMVEQLNTRPNPENKMTTRKLELLHSIVDPKPITARRS